MKKDRMVEWMMAEGAPLAAINARLADHIVSINGKLEYPREFVLNRLKQGEKFTQN